jgi:oligopeptide/dipeptide ABC transporter ATP-binding protein
MSAILLETENLSTWFTVKSTFGRKSSIRAVDGVSLTVRERETFGLVGESGSGKSTLGRSVLGLIKPTGGAVRFGGRDVHALKGADLKQFRREAQLVFQDPAGCLNPRRKIGDILLEPLRVHRLGTPAERRRSVAAILETVGMGEHFCQRYPHEISGGQKQRVGIARALLLRPRLLICDEPVSALDVSIQAQVLNLLKDIQGEYALTYLFISHDLSVVHYVSDRVGVMYYGRIIETAAKDELFARPMHPYTQALIAAIPQLTPGEERERQLLEGDNPDPSHTPTGCRFHPRCPQATESCRSRDVPLREISPDHFVACIRS